MTAQSARRGAALLAAVALALLNLSSLAGAGYARVAERGLDRPESPATLAAARIASERAPWSGTHAALHGWVLAENRDAGAALATYATALRLAPADPLLWAEYALALGRLGQFGEPMTLAVARARELAPVSPAVRATVADLGLSYWQRGDARLQALWLAAMAEQRHTDRGAFLGHALTRGQGRAFCRGPARELGEQAWCATIEPALAGGCYELTPGEPVPCRPGR
jgi:hypothetical protein